MEELKYFILYNDTDGSYLGRGTDTPTIEEATDFYPEVIEEIGNIDYIKPTTLDAERGWYYIQEDADETEWKIFRRR